MLTILDTNIDSNDEIINDEDLIKYSSIVKPSNDFNFNNKDLYNKYKEKRLINQLSPINIPKIHFDNDLQKNKYLIKRNKIDSLHSYLKYFQSSSSSNNILSNKTDTNKNIKQKLKDVYFELQKTNDGVSDKKKNFFNNINLISNKNSINPYNIFSQRIINIRAKNKSNSLINYIHKLNDDKKPNVSNKLKFFKKFENLNHILYSKPESNVYGNILNDDDFVTLEEKIQSFENKFNSHKNKDKEIFDVDFSQINNPYNNNDIDNINNSDFVSEMSDIINND